MNIIPIARPLFGPEELEAVQRPLRAGWVIQGPEVAAFEAEAARAFGAPYACAVASGTAALHLALRALGVGEGDEVLTVSHSFIATANAVRYVGATPVFVDILPRTYNMDTTALPDALSPRTKAVLCVHQLGMPCDLGAVLAFARAHGLPVIEDAACAIGSEVRLSQSFEPIGAPHGDIACFSFHPRKVLTTGDGGLLTTKRADLDAMFRRWRSHSMAAPTAARHGSAQVGVESFEDLGFNYRMTDLQAAVGRVQLGRLPDIVTARRRWAARYDERLADLSVVTPLEPAYARSNWQSYCVRLPAGVSQQGVMQEMLDLGVSTRRGVTCTHRQPAYAKEPWRCARGPGACGCSPRTCAALRESERAEDEGLMLPLYPQMTEEEHDRVVDALTQALRAHTPTSAP